jgi:hypothetical protein
MKTLEDGRTFHAQCWESGYTTKSHLYVQWNLHQNCNQILHRDRKVNPKIHMEAQKTLNSHSNPEEKEQHWIYH